VRALVDTFWSIDGHHDTFRARSHPIPAVFDCFSGYNVPEKSKHRNGQSAIFPPQHCSLSQMPFFDIC